MIELPIAKQPGTGGEKMHVDEAEGMPARTRYRVIERAGNRTAWVELQPFTGRTHQLRVHMAAIGHPIVGDGKYGGPAAFLTGGISRKMHLHARRIARRSSRWRQDRRRGRTADAFRRKPGAAGLRRDARQHDADRRAAPRRPRPRRSTRAKAHAKTVRKERKGERRGAVRPRRSRAAPRRAKPCVSPPSETAKPANRAPAAGKLGDGGRPAKPAAARPRSRYPVGGEGDGTSALMHPNAAFRCDDRDALRALAATRLRACCSRPRPTGRWSSHVPRVCSTTTRCASISRAATGIARASRRRDAVLLSVLGPDGYVSPDWYARPGDQVPTWNYVAVELEGTMRADGRRRAGRAARQLAADQEAARQAAVDARQDGRRRLFDRMLRGDRRLPARVAAMARRRSSSARTSPTPTRGRVAALTRVGQRTALASRTGCATREPPRALRLRRHAGRQPGEYLPRGGRGLRRCRPGAAAARRDPADRRAEPGRGDAAAAAATPTTRITARWPQTTRTRSSAADERRARRRSRCSTGSPICSTRCAADGWLLGVATGKSDRGLPHVLARTASRHHFVTLQTADRHPSKPAPVDDRGGDGGGRRCAARDRDDRRHQLRHGDGDAPGSARSASAGAITRRRTDRGGRARRGAPSPTCRTSGGR